MAPSWQDFEAHVRQTATFIWERPAEPENIGGVDIDCVLHTSQAQVILIEITEERTLNKVREDVIKLDTARNALWNANKTASTCYCVVNGTITEAMRGAGTGSNIQVVSISRFSKLYFDFATYEHARLRKPFGSAVIPATGAIDNAKYVPVTYRVDGTSKEMTVSEIAQQVADGKRIILLGEYGSGKSTCVKQVFSILAAAGKKDETYPIAVDLRDTWGLRRAAEIITRHIEELGLDRGQRAIIKALGASGPTPFCFLLDGFDEVGSQVWSDDQIKLRNIRAESLAGIRDLIAKSKGGLLICGREHYFSGDPEMYEALGLPKETTVLLRSKPEFTDEEMEAFLAGSSPELQDLALPEWLPKRPLICQVIANLPADQIAKIFGKIGGDVEFWDIFISAVCQRDANINTSFDPKILRKFMIRLARFTRTKSANVGPLSLNEIQRAFEEVVGQAPVDQAIMLQRLPGLGRVRAESNDRQFIDVYILDGLRAEDIVECVENPTQLLEHMAWLNPLDQLGQRVLASQIGKTSGFKKYLGVASRCASLRNRVVASDIVASLLRLPVATVDFAGLALDEGSFLSLDLSSAKPANLRISNSIFGSIVFADEIQTTGNSISDCSAAKVYGITSERGLPNWVTNLKVDQYESIENVSRIRKASLDAAHQILVVIIRKTFFQKGSGRKEEALLRGLGSFGSRALANRILNLLIHEGMMTKFPGDEGPVYAPVRRHTGRMTKMLAELTVSTDPIWIECGKL